ncbi:predicted protein [Nematostella vectensis]|uniref:Uncharacterized protein n=1 Tax=Nematostella vectensis TaxID=45351 RepID=A7T5K0_NEMVE|nr:predicted protein [Nematostella vectensis]|eukprot:XP_001620861.1 hypothetical protein NEMVEDRAFT_v1g222633 [Nematostella vectensis]
MCTASPKSAQKPGKKPRSGPVHGVEEFSDESDDYFFYVESVGAVNAAQCKRKIFASMQLRDEQVKFQLDCGATVNILPIDKYVQIFNDPSHARLKKTNKTLQMFNKTELKPIGTVKIESVNPKNEDAILLVVNQGHRPILGAQAIQQFQLMTINSDNILSVNEFQSTQQDIVSEFGDVSEGDGVLQEKLHLEVDKTVTPVALPVRKVPFADFYSFLSPLNYLEKNTTCE